MCKENDYYRIEVPDYSKYNTEDDYNAAVTWFNIDIIAGNTPDIIEVSHGMSYNPNADMSLINIIREEAGNYFKGLYSAADAARIIQSKVEIYVSERR